MAGPMPLPSVPWHPLHCCSASILPALASPRPCPPVPAPWLSEQPATASESATQRTRRFIASRDISSPPDQAIREADQDHDQEDQARGHQSKAQDLRTERHRSRRRVDQVVLELARRDETIVGGRAVAPELL